MYHSYKDNLITDAMYNAQIKFPLEKQTIVLTNAVTYFTGVISQDWKQMPT